MLVGNGLAHESMTQGRGLDLGQAPLDREDRSREDRSPVARPV